MYDAQAACTWRLATFALSFPSRPQTGMVTVDLPLQPRYTVFNELRLNGTDCGNAPC